MTLEVATAPKSQRQLHKPKIIPPFSDPTTGVNSRDVVISTDPGISARIFLPRLHDPTQKLPILFYVHGGGSHDTAFSRHYHRHVTSLCAGARAIGVSVEYRLARPEHPIPACYDDTWAALQWLAAHVDRSGPDTWLNRHADFSNVFVGGDSAGANVAHNVISKAGSHQVPKIMISGMFLVHPYFGGIEEDDRMWMYLCPSNRGPSDPRLTPPARDLAQIPCRRVLVIVAGEDCLNGAGRCYYWNLKKSGWKGTVELVECQGEDHCFHLQRQSSEKALDMVRKIVSFISQGCIKSSL